MRFVSTNKCAVRFCLLLFAVVDPGSNTVDCTPVRLLLQLSNNNFRNTSRVQTGLGVEGLRKGANDCVNGNLSTYDLRLYVRC